MVNNTLSNFVGDDNEQQYAFGKPVDSKKKKYVFGVINSIGAPFVWNPTPLQKNQSQGSTRVEQLATADTSKEGHPGQEVKILESKKLVAPENTTASQITIDKTDNKFRDQENLGKTLGEDHEREEAEELAKPKEIEEGRARARLEVESELVSQLTPEVVATQKAELTQPVQAELREELISDVESRLAMLKAELRNSIQEELRNELKAELNAQCEKIASICEAEMRTRLREELIPKVKAELREELTLEVKAELMEVMKNDLDEFIGPRIGEYLVLRYGPRLEQPLGCHPGEGPKEMFLKDKQDSRHEDESVHDSDAETYLPCLDGEDCDSADNYGHPRFQQKLRHQGKERSRSPERRGTYRQSRYRSRSPIRQDKHRNRHRSRTLEDEYRHRNCQGMSSYGEHYKPTPFNDEGKSGRRLPADEEHSYTEDEVDYADYASSNHTPSPKYNAGVVYARYTNAVIGMPPKEEAPPSLPPHGLKRSRIELEYDEDDYLGRYAKKPRWEYPESYERFSLGEDSCRFGQSGESSPREDGRSSEESGESGESEESGEEGEDTRGFSKENPINITDSEWEADEEDEEEEFYENKEEELYEEEEFYDEDEEEL